MRSIVRMTALLLSVALLATPLGATVCAGHCAQPQTVAAPTSSHCGAAATEEPQAAAQAHGARLTAVNPCGVNTVPTVLKAGDDHLFQPLLHASSLPPFRVFASAVLMPWTPPAASPPSGSRPHLTPLRI